ncbi:MAG: hypothetical protein A2W25_01855 [candidate division Zixibacteria bacterium RBG_16_53_22]|nr:MAG: hypothetical protein A2W25_01855 [candidate division Zixibacteria bacterium RBG_16_53_22]
MNSRHKLSFVFILILLAAVLIFALSPGCQPKPQYQKIDFTRLEPPGAAAPGESSEVLLRVAFAGVVSPTETLKIYNQMVEYLGQALFRPVEIIQRSNYAEINDLVRSRYVDLAFVCSLAYVVGNNEFGMEILVVPQVGGGTVYHSYIIVPANSKSESLADLRGKAFAFTDPLSNSGRLAPTYRLHQMGATPDNFFGKYVFTYSHDNSIRAVADSLFDGAAVDSLVYDHIISLEPEIGARTRIIEKSPPFGIPPVVVHPALNPEIKARLRSLLLNMEHDQTGRAVLESLHVNRFIIGDDASYDSIRNMMRELGW